LKKSRKRNSSSESGTIAETATATALLREGFGVSFSHGDYMGWDIISDWDGKINRVQVKTATRVRTSYHVNMGKSGKNGSLYTREQTDVIAVFLPYSRDYKELNDDGIYIIPVGEVNKTTAHFWPAGLGARKDNLCQYQKYQDAFNLLK
tara:strand:+ start:18543 stop:18989 length:447 start_codon:yes stop_codon:yes gene_type:complete